jgi:hypothetical protein
MTYVSDKMSLFSFCLRGCLFTKRKIPYFSRLLTSTVGLGSIFWSCTVPYYNISKYSWVMYRRQVCSGTRWYRILNKEKGFLKVLSNENTQNRGGWRLESIDVSYYCVVGRFPFDILKRHHHERNIKLFPASQKRKPVWVERMIEIGFAKQF